MHRVAVVGVLGAFLAATVVSPAVGGPSVSKIARQAKVALKIGKKANRGARIANRRSGRAHRLAFTANEKGDMALGRVGTVAITRVKQEVSAPPGEFARFDVRCPDGHVSVGHGVGNGALDPVITVPQGNGYIASMSNLSGSDTFSGILYVVCAEGAAKAAISSAGRSAALRARHAAERDALAASGR